MQLDLVIIPEAPTAFLRIPEPANNFYFSLLIVKFKHIRNKIFRKINKILGEILLTKINCEKYILYINIYVKIKS